MESDTEVFRYELTVKNPETGLENLIIVHATSEEQALLTAEKPKELVIAIEKKHVIQTESNNR